jgi:purine-nucleoside phosphorylase
MIEKIKETSDFLASKLEGTPRIALITGTGLGSLTERMSPEFRVSYQDIPHFPRSTTHGHKGVLVAGEIGGKNVIALEGRFHLYEGYTPQEVTFPVRVMALLGVQYLLVSSAAGGLNPLFSSGELMVLTDHINLTGTNPLVGSNLDNFGTRFPDMSQVYGKDLVYLARQSALTSGIHLREGVYVGLLGPSLETPAETRFLRLIGADAVGMSTVSETIVAAHCGLKVLAIVVITNINLPDCMKSTSLEEVISTAERSGPALALLWERIIGSLPA